MIILFFLAVLISCVICLFVGLIAFFDTSKFLMLVFTPSKIYFTHELTTAEKQEMKYACGCLSFFSLLAFGTVCGVIVTLLDELLTYCL